MHKRSNAFVYIYIYIYISISAALLLWPWLTMKWRRYDLQVFFDVFWKVGRLWIYRHFISCWGSGHESMAFYVLLFSIELYCYCSSCMKPTVPTFSIRYDPNLRYFCKCMELGETWYQYPQPDTVSCIYIYILSICKINWIHAWTGMVYCWWMLLLKSNKSIGGSDRNAIWKC